MYETPKSDLIENLPEKPGGWLLLFKALNIILVSLFPISVLATFVLPIIDPVEKYFTWDNLAINIELLPSAFFSVLILRNLDKREKTTPFKIKRLMGYDICCTLVVGASIFIAYRKGFVTDRPMPFFISLIYYFVWISYFKWSKKVKRYYKVNG